MAIDQTLTSGSSEVFSTNGNESPIRDVSVQGSGTYSVKLMRCKDGTNFYEFAAYDNTQSSSEREQSIHVPAGSTTKYRFDWVSGSPKVFLG